MQKEIDVFISYSRKDYIDAAHVHLTDNVITELKNRFLEKGITFWIDEEGIYSGDAFAQIIARNIRMCKIVVFVSSVNSNNSSWTSNEIATAVEYKKVIIPLRIDDSPYHEDIVLYLAKLDYIACYIDKEKGLNRLIDSILRYKQKWEDERIEALRIQEEQDRIEREKEEKRKRLLLEEQEKREQERLAAIAFEKKRREEELTMILNQIFELEKTESELECKKDEIDEERKNVDREIYLIHKRLEHLETRRSVIELQLKGDTSTVIKNQQDSNKIPRVKENNVKTRLLSLYEKLKKYSFRSIVSGRALTIIFPSVVALFLSYVIWGVISKRETDNNPTDNTEINTSEDAKNTDISDRTKPYCVIPIEHDSVYGIETIDKIKWKNLNVRLSDSDNQLHKVSFALMLCTSGKNDYLGEAYEYNRAQANENGIYFASYHLLNVKSTWKYATGEKQADNYISHVGKLHLRELPPVLSIPVIEKEDMEIARVRCVTWLRRVTEQYGVKPIIFVGQSTYEDYVKDWNLDNTIWMPTANLNVDSIKFQKLHCQEVCFFNDTISQESKSFGGRLSVYLGTYKDFIERYGE